MRLSYGEIDWPDDSARQAFVREEFLKAIAEHAPETCTFLYDRVLPLYRAADECDELSMSNLRQGLAAWAQEFNLTAQWCVDAACAALSLWTGVARPDPLGFVPLGRAYSLIAPLLKDGPKAPAVMRPTTPTGLPAYEPLTQTREGYLDQVCFMASKTIQSDPLLSYGEISQDPRLNLGGYDASPGQAFAGTIRNSQAVTHYCSAVEACYLEKGYERCSDDEKRSLATHLEWAVRFQVKGESQAAIVRSTQLAGQPVTKTAVSLAITETLSRISLPKRS